MRKAFDRILRKDLPEFAFSLARPSHSIDETVHFQEEQLFSFIRRNALSKKTDSAIALFAGYELFTVNIKIDPRNEDDSFAVNARTELAIPRDLKNVQTVIERVFGVDSLQFAARRGRLRAFALALSALKKAYDQHVPDETRERFFPRSSWYALAITCVAYARGFQFSCSKSLPENWKNNDRVIAMVSMAHHFESMLSYIFALNQVKVVAQVFDQMHFTLDTLCVFSSLPAAYASLFVDRDDSELMHELAKFWTHPDNTELQLVLREAKEILGHLGYAVN